MSILRFSGAFSKSLTDSLRTSDTVDFELFAQPFTIIVDAVRDDLQMELIELQCDSEVHVLDKLLQMCPSKQVDVQAGTSDSNLHNILSL